MRIPITINNLHLSWSHLNREVLWGWKRDSGHLQRIILFGASLKFDAPKMIQLENWFLYYRNRSRPEAIGQLANLLRNAAAARDIGSPEVRKCPRTGLAILKLSGGPGLPAQSGLIRRLLNRRPRRHIPTGVFPTPSESTLRIEELGPTAAYVGSGLSYESDLPTLAEVHETFGVDQLGSSDFTFGADDPIPTQLAESVPDTLAKFINFHLLAAVAVPSQSHRKVASLYRSGRVTRILTDNVDNLFSELDIPFTRTRGVGIFNDRFPISFDRGERALLVIGVAADRRGIIQQARMQGLRIIVVNPQYPVSPRSQSLNYLRSHDIWYRLTAEEFFTKHVLE